jgi:hypothetical protein
MLVIPQGVRPTFLGRPEIPLGVGMATTWQPKEPPQGAAEAGRESTVGIGVERRRVRRGKSESEPDRAELVSMIVGTYHEMPGLSLHLAQAARLFGLKRTTCELVLEYLVDRGELRRARDGQYVLP